MVLFAMAAFVAYMRNRVLPIPSRRVASASYCASRLIGAGEAVMRN